MDVPRAESGTFFAFVDRGRKENCRQEETVAFLGMIARGWAVDARIGCLIYPAGLITSIAPASRKAFAVRGVAVVGVAKQKEAIAIRSRKAGLKLPGGRRIPLGLDSQRTIQHIIQVTESRASCAFGTPTTSCRGHPEGNRSHFFGY